MDIIMWLLQGVLTVLITAFGFVLASYYKNIEEKLNKIINLQIDNEVIKMKISQITDNMEDCNERIKTIEEDVVKLKQTQHVHYKKDFNE